MEKSKIVKVSLVETSPSTARKMADMNYYKNRNKKPSHVNMIADDMKEGRFNSENGQTIVRDEEVVIYDGQHRLEAQVIADVTLTWLIVTVDNGPAAWASLDQTARRGAADFLAGKEYATLTAALAKVGYAVDYGDVPFASALQGKKHPKACVSTAEQLEYIAQNGEKLELAVKRGWRVYSQMKCGGTVPYAAFAFILDWLGQDEALDGFIEDASKVVPESATIVSMQRKIIKSYHGSGTKPNRNWLMGLLFDAYDHYSAVDGSVELNKQTAKFNKYAKMIDKEREARRTVL